MRNYKVCPDSSISGAWGVYPNSLSTKVGLRCRAALISAHQRVRSPFNPRDGMSDVPYNHQDCSLTKQRANAIPFSPGEKARMRASQYTISILSVQREIS
jgi:hypothetical protein